MLYYFFEFIKALIYHPLDIVWNIKQLYNIWRLDKKSKIINEVIFITDLTRIGNAPHDNSLQCEYSNSHLGRIVQYLDNAKYSIDIAVYALNSVPISRALQNAHQRGISVRIIIGKWHLLHDNRSNDVQSLNEIPVVKPRIRKNRIMHHKFCIIDGYRRVHEIRKTNDHRSSTAILMTGSFNWITFQRSYDDLLITSNVTLVLNIEQEFFRIWKSIQMGQI